MFEPTGWALDQMRRIPDAPNGLMEYLITQSILQFQKDGCATVSLGNVLFNNINSDEEGNLYIQIHTRVIRLIKKYYNFQTLGKFKEKFGPNWEDRYLVFSNTLFLSKVLIAQAQLQMPSLKLANLYRIISKNKKSKAKDD